LKALTSVELFCNLTISTFTTSLFRTFKSPFIAGPKLRCFVSLKSTGIWDMCYITLEVTLSTFNTEC